MKITIDRFEEEFAIVELENGEIIEIPKVILPIEAKEGDVVSITVEKTETEERKKRIQNKFDRLFCSEWIVWEIILYTSRVHNLGNVLWKYIFIKINKTDNWQPEN